MRPARAALVLPFLACTRDLSYSHTEGPDEALAWWHPDGPKGWSSSEPVVELFFFVCSSLCLAHQLFWKYLGTSRGLKAEGCAPREEHQADLQRGSSGERAVWVSSSGFLAISSSAPAACSPWLPPVLTQKGRTATAGRTCTLLLPWPLGKSFLSRCSFPWIYHHPCSLPSSCPHLCICFIHGICSLNRWVFHFSSSNMSLG